MVSKYLKCDIISARNFPMYSFASFLLFVIKYLFRHLWFAWIISNILILLNNIFNWQYYSRDPYYYPSIFLYFLNIILLCIWLIVKYIKRLNPNIAQADITRADRFLFRYGVFSVSFFVLLLVFVNVINWHNRQSASTFFFVCVVFYFLVIPATLLPCIAVIWIKGK